jgi:WhiB family transcriptional regulator, redox-sensing transcriptional regulator
MTNVARLPGPIADIWDWQRLGLCRGRDSAQFFHPDGERGASRGRREAAAKALCHSCPVRAECAAHALSTREPYGVWGGFTEAERLRLLSSGWEDLADRGRSRVDVRRLEARLGLRGTPTPPVAAPPARSAVPTASSPASAAQRTVSGTAGAPAEARGPMASSTRAGSRPGAASRRPAAR